jgi:hypothetical protein
MRHVGLLRVLRDRLFWHGLLVAEPEKPEDFRQCNVNNCCICHSLGTKHSHSCARATELAQYELIDRFDSNKNQWQTGPLLGIDWKGTPQLESGVFVWDIEDVYDSQAMISMEFVPVNNYVKNYNTYVDTKISNVPSGLACSGLIFRQAPLGWNAGGYSFAICSAGFFGIYYHNAQDGWQEINAQYHASIRRYDWNRLEILVNDSHFIFLINSQMVYETDDDRQPVGGVALMVEAQGDGTQILFDNFGFQSR